MFVELTARYRGRVRGPGSRLADWVLAAVHHADTEELHTSEESLLLKAVDRSTDLPLAHDCVHLVRHGTHRGHGPRPPRNGNNKYSMLYYTTYVYEKLNIFCAVFIDCGMIFFSQIGSFFFSCFVYSPLRYLASCVPASFAPEP